MGNEFQGGYDPRLAYGGQNLDLGYGVENTQGALPDIKNIDDNVPVALLNPSFSAGQSRALMMGLEVERGLPRGSLQALTEQMTGYRNNNPLLPQHRLNERNPNRVLEHEQAANRFQEKMAEFDGIVPLAIDAYIRGDKATRKSISGAGFDQDAVNNIYSTMARMPKYGGEEIDTQSMQVMQSVIGKPSKDLSGVRKAPPPKPVKPIQLYQTEGGKYRTGDAFLDAVMDIESGGNTSAVSPTGATGLFQFTRGTAKRYGLITKDGRDLRKDPQANLRAMLALTKDNAAYLKSKGVPVNPSTLYLAHQQGAGGAVEILRAAREGREVSPAIRRNMNLNNGKGKTPAQFVAMFDQKVRSRMGENVEGFNLDAVDEMMANIPSTGSAEIADAGGLGDIMQSSAESSSSDDGQGEYATDSIMASTDEVSGAASESKNGETPLGLSVDWMAKLDEAFALKKQIQQTPSTLRKVIEGIVNEV